jgi:hypothetical protein
MSLFGTNTPYFGFTGATGGLSNTQSFCTPLTLLGSEISYFQTNCIDSEVELIWESHADTDLDYYTVMRSKDGQQRRLLMA